MKLFAKNQKLSAQAFSSRRGFTLMEVMIACGILFMCLFGILALVSNSLRNARALQQHKSVDAGTVASMIYVALANTNSVTEGEIPVDLSDTLPGYKCFSTLTQIGSNGLCQVDFEVQRNNTLEVQSHFLIFLPNMKQGGISSTLPQH
ncbi:MAG TPA: prepilin-type N-terminal cleavage/methylation domain-containing protein [Verrucomicrobiae bacterium]|nr:prepilin-type N-terminal cleavage/methylation domain-containing protein [Verrucomicrobiae bacterium]